MVFVEEVYTIDFDKFNKNYNKVENSSITEDDMKIYEFANKFFSEDVSYSLEELEKIDINVIRKIEKLFLDYVYNRKLFDKNEEQLRLKEKIDKIYRYESVLVNLEYTKADTNNEAIPASLLFF